MREEVGILLSVLDHCNNSPEYYLGDFDRTDPTLVARRADTLELLVSFIVMSTMLVECLGPGGASITFSNLFFSKPKTAYLTKPFIESTPTILKPKEWYVNGPATTFRTRLRQVAGWSTVGEIVGLQEIAQTILKSRLQKWDAGKGWMSAIKPSDVVELLDWYINQGEEPLYYINISTWESRHRGAVLCAIVEFMVEFGFPMTAPVVRLDVDGLRARVGRVILDSESEVGNAASPSLDSELVDGLDPVS